MKEETWVRAYRAETWRTGRIRLGRLERSVILAGGEAQEIRLDEVGYQKVVLDSS